jgi:ABC-type phosphate/phosphonate transport system substrate-binding protein
MKRMIERVLLAGIIIGLFLPGFADAEQFRIAIMQDQTGAAQKFQPLLDYLKKTGIDATFIATKDYPGAAAMFAAGEADAMFSGSGIAGTMIIKGLAVPLVRPMGKDGHSTYWAVVVAPKGSPKFTGSADYLKGKKVILTALASAGEFYYRSLPGAVQANATLLKAASHGAAIDALDKGQADVAIVKNRVWDKSKGKYPNLTKVGEDKGENPDGALIVSVRVPQETAAKISAALIGVKDDASPEAEVIRNSLEIQGYIKTTPKDFDHTLVLLKKAGVTKAFNFAY